ncbi:MAG: DivIVA domain-containing protein [Propionibacteriaceae bacterium]|nr:DivIVA domain-containing protein [Propionibacteriaceae bacterium]
MWIAIGAVAVAVLVAAAFAGLGKFGEMPARAVTDRPKGHVPDGVLTPDLLAELRIPQAFTGYRPEQVDAYLAQVAAGTAGPASETLFDVVRGGYDMQVVDQLLERPRPVPEPALPPQPGEILPDAE